MHLNDISLSDQLLTALYAQTLVVTEPMVPAKIQFLGKNNHQFVILVNYPDQLHLPDESFNFLGTVLKACQLNAADVAIVNLAKQAVSIEILLQQLSPRIILDFTNASIMEGLPASLLQPMHTPNFQYLQSPSLEMLLQGGDAVKPQKKLLWEGLKQMLQL
jgi:hypothetical protein